MSSLPTLPPVPGAEPDRVALDGFRIDIADKVAKIVGLDIDKVYEGVQFGQKGADFTLPIPRLRLKEKAQETAERIAKDFQTDAYISAVTASGVFVHFNVNHSTLARLTLHQIRNLTHNSPSGKPEYGSNTTGKGKKIVVEFSSPNIAKPFHAGHLRSTIIGAYISNLYEANGWSVHRLNYLGDWGKQFGLLAVGWERYGDEAALKEDAIKHLYDVYVKVNRDGEDKEEGEAIHDKARAYFKDMEEGKEDALALWRKFRDLSIEKYKQTYARLNIHFDEYSGESQVSKEGMDAAMERLQTTGVLVEDKGALLVDLTKFKLDKAVVRKRDGTNLYITRDIGGAVQRWERHKFDKMIYVVASQQDLHLAQFFKVLELMGYEWANRLQHVNFGMVQGMSTRKGTAVFLEHILEEAKDNMHEVMKKNEVKYSAVENPEATADVVGMSAVKIQDMSGKRINNYTFDWSRMLSFEGDTGPYLQYTHARLASVERKNASVQMPSDPTKPKEEGGIDTDLLSEPKAKEVIFLLASYPDVVRTATKDLQPSTVVTWCMKCAHAVSSAWEQLIVKGSEEETAKARLYLYVCARDVLGSAMRLLSLTPLERM